MKKVLLLLLIISLLMSGCVIQETPAYTDIPTVTLNDAPTITPETETDNNDINSTKSSTYGVGEILDINGVNIVLESVEKSYGDKDEEFSISAPEEGKIFVICNFYVENNSDGDFNINSFDFNAYEDDFSIHEYIFVSGLGIEELIGTASPGKKIKGSLVYEVSEDFKELELEYQPSIWNDDKYSFIVKNE